MKLGDLAALGALSEKTGGESLSVRVGYDGKPIKLKIQFMKSGRGKMVTMISGFQSSPKELDALARELKQQCGAGGSVGDNTIELQGDQRTKVQTLMSELGYQLR